MIKTINFTEINPISNKQIKLIKKGISSTIKKKDFILGSSVQKFENEFSMISGIKYCVSCASGTDALTLALMSLNLQKNDEVIVPGFTYISTGLSVLFNNNKLICADIDKQTGLISFDDVIAKMTKKTKVIIPVNLYGQKVDLKKLREIVGNKIYLIEDSAQSHFAYSCYKCINYKRNKCCKKNRNEKYADISCYSFYPAKNLGAYGDGGLIATNSFATYKRLSALRNLGALKKNRHSILGRNSRLDTIQSIVLRVKLGSILKFNDLRRKISNYYDENLINLNQINLTNTNPGSSRHLYVIRTKKRDVLLKYLKTKKINCQIHYPYSFNKIKFFNKKGNKITLLNSQNWSKQCLSLPLHPKLKIFHAKRVIKEIKNFFQYK
jgi:dTDP-4-amino-4,6-dideoxygalactose transaminase|tara:strand:+ start:3940 stop:5082 length:1143 start_codon:yes stop_codon:yes gene_type:complete